MLRPADEQNEERQQTSLYVSIKARARVLDTIVATLTL